eukprot:2476694-Prymnesium_polylepis.1
MLSLGGVFACVGARPGRAFGVCWSVEDSCTHKHKHMHRALRFATAPPFCTALSQHALRTASVNPLDD